MKKLLTSMLALGACLAISGVTARAENHPVGVIVQNVHPHGPMVPPSGASAGLSLTDLTLGTYEGEYPYYSEPFFAQPIPISATKVGAPIITTLQMQDTFYTGAPTVTYSLLQNGVVISTSTLTFPFDLVQNEEAAASFADTAPMTTGRVQINVMVTSGSTMVGSMSSHFDVLQ